jgi:excisionase family DNA binding protein
MGNLSGIKSVLERICEVLNEQNQKARPINRAMSVREVKERFNIGSNSTVLELFQTKSSPAYKVGRSWRVDEEDFKKFLIKNSAQYKG